MLVTEKELQNRDKAAFAVVSKGYLYQEGLTKREYFAGQALNGLLAGGFSIHEDAAGAAIVFADDLLKELEKS